MLHLKHIWRTMRVLTLPVFSWASTFSGAFEDSQPTLVTTFINKEKASLHTTWKLKEGWRFILMYSEPQRVTRASHQLRVPAFIIPDRAFDTDRIGGWVGPTVVLEVSEKRKAFCACRDSKNISLLIQPAAWSLYRPRYPGSEYLLFVLVNGKISSSGMANKIYNIQGYS